jgi:hypothetical protein
MDFGGDRMSEGADRIGRSPRSSGTPRGESLMALLIVPFLVLAAVGLVLSLVAHGCALLGLPQPLGGATWGLHVGIFAVWLPAMLASNRMVRGTRPDDFWRVALRGCPPWMRRMTYGFFGYAVANFLIFFATAPVGKQPAGAPAPPEVFRGFSGHWMAFYSAALAILYSAAAVSRCGEDKHLGGKPTEGRRDEAAAPVAMWDRELDG